MIKPGNVKNLTPVRLRKCMGVFRGDMKLVSVREEDEEDEGHEEDGVRQRQLIRWRPLKVKARRRSSNESRASYMFHE